MPVAETERLILRCFEARDAEAKEAVFCSPEVMRYSDGVQSPEWVRAWIAEMIEAQGARSGLGTWAVVEKSAGEVIGYCGLSHCPERCGADEAELGYRLTLPHWGRGYASESAKAVRDYGLYRLRLPRIIAIIDPHNLASLRVARSIGMRFEREIMITARAQHQIERLLAKPAVQCLDAGLSILEQVEHVAAVDQHIPFQRPEFFVPLVGVADDDNSHDWSFPDFLAKRC